MSFGGPELLILLGLLTVPVLLIALLVNAAWQRLHTPVVDPPLGTPAATGWYPDPLVAGRRRYFDGQAWTDRVGD